MFELHSKYQPTGDQPQAIERLTEGIRTGDARSGAAGRNRLRQDLHHGQHHREGAAARRWSSPTTRRWRRSCAAEFREFFPNNAVGYFVSYYDYYQPEAYIASTDTFIEKDSSINDEIDRMRHSATACAGGAAGRDHRGLASAAFTAWATPRNTRGCPFPCAQGMQMERDDLLRKLIDIQYDAQRFRI